MAAPSFLGGANAGDGIQLYYQVIYSYMLGGENTYNVISRAFDITATLNTLQYTTQLTLPPK